MRKPILPGRGADVVIIWFMPLVCWPLSNTKHETDERAAVACKSARVSHEFFCVVAVMVAAPTSTMRDCGETGRHRDVFALSPSRRGQRHDSLKLLHVRDGNRRRAFSAGRSVPLRELNPNLTERRKCFAPGAVATAQEHPTLSIEGHAMIDIPAVNPSPVPKSDAWFCALASDGRLSPRARLIAGRLTLFNHDPTYEQIGNAIGCGRRSAIRAITELVERGWLEKDASQGRVANRYLRAMRVAR
jgi:hypothetical protein